MRLLTAAVAGACIVLGVTVVTAQKNSPVKFREFSAFEVEDFENSKMETKEPMPDSWIPTLREDIVQRVIGLHKFGRVADFEDPKAKPAASGGRVLLLKGKIAEFTHGSQAKRFLLGFGAGAGKIAAVCQFVDKETGQVIWERKVDGKVIGTGQSTEGIEGNRQGCGQELVGGLMKRLLIVPAVLAAALAWPSPTASAEQAQLRAYTSIELAPIDNSRNEEGQRIPPESVPDLKEQIETNIAALHLFHKVGEYVDRDVSQPEQEEPLQLRVKILSYTGARNSAGVKARLTFVDSKSGTAVLVKEINAQLRLDSGALSAALRKLARSTASFVKDNW
jgi:hypothetical protein